ncbi:hypothetical protein [Bacillus toyonensis]|uniref:hypothetical protein n=1 Tax=Bacillus toyonensis TaxID=155322 RepID=UPI000BF2EDF0|nr:hypothetical protein [Bacillus toyonensis]PEU35550.1 hypothetical protein CN537_25345 [Bacillus toyonensis]
MKALLRTIDGSEHVVNEGRFLFEEYEKRNIAIFNDGNTIDIFDDNGTLVGIVNMKYVTAIKFEV